LQLIQFAGLSGGLALENLHCFLFGLVLFFEFDNQLFVLLGGVLNYGEFLLQNFGPFVLHFHVHPDVLVGRQLIGHKHFFVLEFLNKCVELHVPECSLLYQFVLKMENHFHGVLR
jgi:hypothetical protein